MALRHLWLLLHIQHPHLVVDNDDPRPLQLFYRWLFVTHDTRRTLLTGKVHKLLEREEQQVVGSYDQDPL